MKLLKISKYQYASVRKVKSNIEVKGVRNTDTLILSDIGIVRSFIELTHS